MRARRRNLLLCLLPWGYCVAATARYGYDAPYWDQWYKIPMIAKAFEGTLGLSDLWTLINEHRIFFPNVIAVPIARLTHWDLRAELGLTLLFATLAFWIILRMFTRIDVRGSLWAAPIAAVLFFSYSQHGVWMWSLHFMITLTVLCLVGIVYLLGAPSIQPRSIVASILLAIVASYSFGAGIVAWPLGALMVLLAPSMSSRRRATLLSVWGVCALVTMLVYFIGYESTPASESAIAAIRRPLAFVLYVLAYIGAPLFSFSPQAAVVAGLAGGVASVYLLFHLFRGGEDLRTSALPFAGLVFIGWSVAGLVGLKQLHEGIAQAVSSRYIPWPTLFWVGLLGLAYLRRLTTDKALPRWEGRALGAAVGLGLALALASSAYGTYRADERHDAFLLGRQALLEGRMDADILFLYPDTEVPIEMRDVLVRHRLSIFQDE